MTPEQAQTLYPTAFDSEEVYNVVAEAVRSAEATLYVQDNVLMYHDPAFSNNDYPVSELRYRVGVGLSHMSWK